MKKLILDGDLDIANYAETTGPHERLHYNSFFRERMMILLKKNDAFAAKSAIAIQDLQTKDYINRIICNYNAAAIWGGDDNRWRIAHGSDRYDWVLAMVAGGLGFAFLLAFSVRHPDVASRPLNDPDV